MANQRKASMHLGGPFCKFCGDVVESIMHVLRGYPMPLVIWMNLLNDELRDKCFSTELSNWIDLNLNNQLGVDVVCDWEGGLEHCLSLALVVAK